MILVYGLTGLAFAFVVLWFAWPDLCYTGDEADDLPALGESIDRAIALAAALPPENVCRNCGDPIEQDESDWPGWHHVGHGPSGRFYCNYRPDSPTAAPSELTPQPQPLNL